MRVLKAELVEEENVFRDKQALPYTFFELNASEQMAYNNFRVRHGTLENVLSQLRKDGKEDEIKDERRKGEEEVRAMFVELTEPFFKQRGLDIARCLTFYGGSNLTDVETPVYMLFEGDDPFDIGYRVNCWFSTLPESLSCKSSLHFFSGTQGDYRRRVIGDLLRKVIEEKEQDGISFPIVRFRGDFIYFAQVGFAIPLIMRIRDMIMKLGKETIEELKVLDQEYVRQVSYGRTSDTSIQQKVFKEAYERTSEVELIRAGFRDQKFFELVSGLL